MYARAYLQAHIGCLEHDAGGPRLLPVGTQAQRGTYSHNSGEWPRPLHSSSYNVYPHFRHDLTALLVEASMKCLDYAVNRPPTTIDRFTSLHGSWPGCRDLIV